MIAMVSPGCAQGGDDVNRTTKEQTPTTKKQK